MIHVRGKKGWMVKALSIYGMVTRRVSSWCVSGLILLFGINQAFAASITPNDVYSKMELTNRTAEMILLEKGSDFHQTVMIHEENLLPMHVYQMATACIDMMIQVEKRTGVRPHPKIVATPMVYIPEDVYKLADALLREIRIVWKAQRIPDLPEDGIIFSGKVPSDVFALTTQLFFHLGLLADKKEFTPSDVYSQMVRGVSDAKAILTHIDPAKRYRIDAPVSPAGLKPSDVFKECIEIRNDINNLRTHFQLGAIPVPEIPEGYELHPTDVFIQTQIIIAELNLLKMGTGTIYTTPIAVPVDGKSPSDVHQQAALIRYLLAQVIPLKDMMDKNR